MSVYSTNQNRQLYVVAGLEDTVAEIQGKANLAKATVQEDADGCKYLVYNGYGGLIRSDLIHPKSVMWCNVSSPEKTAITLKAVAVELDSTLNSGNPIVGQDYVLRINFRQMYGMSDEDIYQKYGAVHVTSKTATKANFLKEMAYQLVKNFKRLYSPLLYVGLADGSGFTLIENATKAADGTITFTYVPKGDNDAWTGEALSGDATKLIIAEQSQVDEWALGTKPYTPVYFDVVATTVDDTTATPMVENVEWATITDFTSTYAATVPNCYRFADLEYFCMGERGDQYRNIGWPKSIPTKYMVEVGDDKEYFAIDIHYAYRGTCEDFQKSEKTVTLLIPTAEQLDVMTIVEAFGLKEIAKVDGEPIKEEVEPEPGQHG